MYNKNWKETLMDRKILFLRKYNSTHNATRNYISKRFIISLGLLPMKTKVKDRHVATSVT